MWGKWLLNISHFAIATFPQPMEYTCPWCTNAALHKCTNAQMQPFRPFPFSCSQLIYVYGNDNHQNCNMCALTHCCTTHAPWVPHSRESNHSKIFGCSSEFQQSLCSGNASIHCFYEWHLRVVESSASHSGELGERQAFSLDTEMIQRQRHKSDSDTAAQQSPERRLNTVNLRIQHINIQKER